VTGSGGARTGGELQLIDTLTPSVASSPGCIGLTRAGVPLKMRSPGARSTDSEMQVMVSGTDQGYAIVDLGGLEDGGSLQQAGGPLAGREFLINR
jgi:hypothetical protein